MPFKLTGNVYTDENDPAWVKAKTRNYKSHALELKPPKIIVGVSVSLPEEDWYDNLIPIFPVILDTGFTHILEINERHLWDWAVLRKERLIPIHTDKSLKIGNHKYGIYKANIWLHRFPYSGRYGGYNSAIEYPLLLNQDQLFIVEDSNPTVDPHPRLPLLGLSALIANKLNLEIKSHRNEFIIKH